MNAAVGAVLPREVEERLVAVAELPVLALRAGELDRAGRSMVCSGSRSADAGATVSSARERSGARPFSRL